MDWGIKEHIAHHLADNRNLGQLLMLRKSEFDSMYAPLLDEYNRDLDGLRDFIRERDEIWDKLHDVETKEHLVQLGIVNHESVFFNVEKGRYFWVEREHSHIPVFPRRRKNASRIKAMKEEGKGDFVLQWFPLSVLTPEMLHTDLWYNETQSRKFFHIGNPKMEYKNS